MITPQDLADRLEKAIADCDKFGTAYGQAISRTQLIALMVDNAPTILASLRRSVPADTVRADAIRECADIAQRHADVSAKNAAEVTNNIGRMAWTYRADESTFIQRDILALIDVVADEDGVDPSSYRYKTAVAYQIVGAIAKEFDVFEHPEVIRALGYLADHNHIDPLPWPASPLAPSRSAPASGEMGEAVLAEREACMSVVNAHINACKLAALSEAPFVKHTDRQCARRCAETLMSVKADIAARTPSGETREPETGGA